MGARLGVGVQLPRRRWAGFRRALWASAGNANAATMPFGPPPGANALFEIVPGGLSPAGIPNCASSVQEVWRALPLPILILAQWPFWAMENHNAKRRTRFDPGKQALCAFNDGIANGGPPH